MNGCGVGTREQLVAWNRSLSQAKLLVQRFGDEFPVGSDHGLLLMGPCGVGKTHLAVAAMKKINVDYKVLTPVLTMEDALKVDAPKIHAEGNVLGEKHLRRGDALGLHSPLLQAAYVQLSVYMAGQK